MAESEVTRFRQQLLLEEQAARQGLYGLAVVASHEAIEKRMEQGAEYLIQRIAQLVAKGEYEEAQALATDDHIWESVWSGRVPYQSPI
jgi:hypothetical protein